MWARQGRGVRETVWAGEGGKGDSVGRGGVRETVWAGEGGKGDSVGRGRG